MKEELHNLIRRMGVERAVEILRRGGREVSALRDRIHDYEHHLHTMKKRMKAQEEKIKEYEKLPEVQKYNLGKDLGILEENESKSEN